MARTKAIRRVDVVGTGVIGASWATHYLARSFDAVATDPAPNAELELRSFVDEAWAALARVGLGSRASAARLRFVPNLQEALADAGFVPENGLERPEVKIYGPAFRWGVIGRSPQWHLGGGDQLAREENKVLPGLLELRDKVGIEGSGHVDWSRAA